MKHKKGKKDSTPAMDLNLDLTKTEVVANYPREQMACGACASEPETSPEEDKKDTKKVLAVILGIIMIFGVAGGIAYYKLQGAEPVTIEGLHEKNLKGELEPDEGYLYNGYSFVKYADVWYTQLEKGDTIYDVTFNNDPRSVEHIPVEGQLSENFVKDGKLYITFDPQGRDLKWIAVANYGFSRSLAWAFGYEVKAGCTKNITSACGKAGVIKCGDPDKAVVYFKEAVDERVILADDCVIVQGTAEEIVDAKDRLLLRWYGIIEE